MSVIDEIKEKLDIVDVVSPHVRLIKSGQNYKGLCPFHSETDASFYVYPHQQSWHCFGSCVTGGDIFSFVMKKEGIDFAEALRRLAEQAGVKLESRRENVEEDREAAFLQQINKDAAMYFNNLLVKAPEARAAREYLKKRQLSNETVEEFQLGFSLNKWDAINVYLSEKGYALAELTSAGLLIEKEGKYFDRFRNRMMFPIRDQRGRVVGFGGRALDDSVPKYLNSPQTRIFAKGEMLYGLDRASASIRRENMAIIVEGYIDVLAAHQHGFRNVVATMGTALSEKQLSSVKKLAKRIVLALDPDAAGNAATLRDIEVATQSLDRKVVPVIDSSGLVKFSYSLDSEIKIVTLPEGKDPDEVINEGEDVWKGLVEHAANVVDYVIEAATSGIDLSDPRNKAAAVDKVLPILGEIQEPVQQAYYLQKLAGIVGVDERVLQEKLKPTRVKRKGRPQDDSPSPVISNRNPGEDYCLALLLQHPQLKEKAQSLDVEHFEHAVNREIFRAWSQDSSVDSLRATISDSLQEHLDYLLRLSLPPMSDAVSEADLADHVDQMEKSRLRRLKVRHEALLADNIPGTNREAEEVSRVALSTTTDDVTEEARQVVEHWRTDTQIGKALGRAVNRQRKCSKTTEEGDK